MLFLRECRCTWKDFVVATPDEIADGRMWAARRLAIKKGPHLSNKPADVSLWSAHVCLPPKEIDSPKDYSKLFPDKVCDLNHNTRFRPLRSRASGAIGTILKKAAASNGCRASTVGSAPSSCSWRWGFQPQLPASQPAAVACANTRGARSRRHPEAIAAARTPSATRCMSAPSAACTCRRSSAWPSWAATPP